MSLKRIRPSSTSSEQQSGGEREGGGEQEDSDVVDITQQLPDIKVSSTYFKGPSIQMHILKPQIVEQKNGKKHYVWEGLEVKQSKERGVGLFATRRLPQYTVLPYLGLPIDPNTQFNPQFIDMIEKYNYDEYMVGNDPIIDGSPKLYPYIHQTNEKYSIGMLGLSIGALVNEPSPEEVANAFLLGTDHPHIPVVPLNTASIVTSKSIKKGNELLICYGRKADYPTSCTVPTVDYPELFISQMRKSAKSLKNWNKMYTKKYYSHDEGYLLEEIMKLIT